MSYGTPGAAEASRARDAILGLCASSTWYVAINGAAVQASLDELVDDVRAAAGRAHDQDALRLALLGALVQLGWEKALGATADDPDVRAREHSGLEWWTARAREALDQWQPP